MVTLQKSGDSAVKFVFTDSDHYLYGNGEVVVPVNSLSLVIDESDFVTFKKASTNDTFITFDPADSNLGTKEAIEQFYKENMVGSTGGDGSGVTPSEVQEMIDESISGMSDDIQSLEQTKADTSAVTAVASDVSTLSGAVDDARAYYIDFTTLATVGISDDDWDGIVAAIDAHRPIYAGYPRTDGGILYYGVECMNKNVSNTQIVLTSSDDNSHYFYTFTKNGSNDYTFTSETRPYVTDAEKTAWNAKAEPYSAGTGIEISGNVISATGGGGATYSAGTNISIDTANTINCTIPLISTGTYSIKQSSQSSISTPCNLSAVFGHYNNISMSSLNYIFMAGNNNVASNDCEAVFGRYNKNNRSSSTFGHSGNTLFAVGNGAYHAEHNAFEIRQNGDIYFPDTDNTTYQNDYQKPMVRLQDMYGALGGLKLVKCTQAEYDALVSGGTVDANTLYIINNVV